ncbi:MAG: TonB-dependent receptor [Bacteroidales bacterium]|nr:TonB-dependent receptor [Bacteroidales bacterium]
MKKIFLILINVLIFASIVIAQSGERGTIKGRIFNASNNEAVPFASLVIWGTNIGAVSDLDGNFLFTGVKPGYIRIAASTVGFENYLSEEFLVTNSNNAFIEIPMKEMNIKLDEVVVKASPYRKKEESPVSLRRIGIEQIEKNPGGNRDISKVIQSFPGVASTPAFRNDVIVRGGGPSENTFYLDGVEIPNLNHFATQGASGGPVGIINVDFIREVNFYSGAFPANTYNAMSSVLDMKQIDGNKEKLKFKGSVGASDLALTLDGPLSENTTFIASARRSYLQYLFSVLELPFLPTYNDFQFKSRTKIDDKNEISFIGLGAIDQFKLNLDANETPDQKYILSFLPINEQWNYTVGAVYKHYRKNGFNTLVLSRNYLNNTSYKYLDNNELNPKTLDYDSDEIENKFRFERLTNYKNDIKLTYGTGLVYAKYFNKTVSNIFTTEGPFTLDYETYLKVFHYNFFGQLSKPFLNNRLSTSLGLRTDASTFSSYMNNPLNQISPRFSASYALTDNMNINFNTGRYFQRPPYTAMGYKDNNGNYLNKENGLKYISSDHIVAGIEFMPDQKSMISLEGFYKLYSDYPFSLRDSVPLSTKGADFGTFGDEALKSISDGRAYGFEVLARSQDLWGFNAVVSYTYVRSEFKDLRTEDNTDYIPTSWDNKHLLNITATRSFESNWFVGFKWRYVGGAPYTPYDVEASSIRSAWDAKGGPYLDYSNFNKLRLSAFHQLDIRVDKQYYFNKWSFNVYIDIQNLYNFKAEEPNTLVRQKFLQNSENYNDSYIDELGLERYELTEIVSDGSGTILPTIGIIVEF